MISGRSWFVSCEMTLQCDVCGGHFVFGVSLYRVGTLSDIFTIPRKRGGKLVDTFDRKAMWKERTTRKVCNNKWLNITIIIMFTTLYEYCITWKEKCLLPVEVAFTCWCIFAVKAHNSWWCCVLNTNQKALIKIYVQLENLGRFFGDPFLAHL